MTHDQAIDVIARLEAGFHFDAETVREARSVIRLEHDWHASGLPCAPDGCVWERPAPGWIDLRRWRQ